MLPVYAPIAHKLCAEIPAIVGRIGWISMVFGAIERLKQDGQQGRVRKKGKRRVKRCFNNRAQQPAMADEKLCLMSSRSKPFSLFCSHQ